MKLLSSLLLLSTLIIVGCSDTQESAEKEIPKTTAYDQNSWKELIDPSCQSFSDGCNNCQRMKDGELAACTKKACAQYEEPKCLDETKKEENPYVGLTVEEAKTKAKVEETLFRVVEIDGQPQAATMDYRPGRINAATKNGKVISITIE